MKKKSVPMLIVEKSASSHSCTHSNGIRCITVGMIEPKYQGAKMYINVRDRAFIGCQLVFGPFFLSFVVKRPQM